MQHHGLDDQNEALVLVTRTLLAFGITGIWSAPRLLCPFRVSFSLYIFANVYEENRKIYKKDEII